MEDFICLLPTRDDLIDPLGSRRREGSDKGFHHTFVELGGLLDENDVLLGILRVIDGISGQDAQLGVKHRPCEYGLQLQEK